MLAHFGEHCFVYRPGVTVGFEKPACGAQLFYDKMPDSIDDWKIVFGDAPLEVGVAECAGYKVNVAFHGGSEKLCLAPGKIFAERGKDTRRIFKFRGIARATFLL